MHKTLNSEVAVFIVHWNRPQECLATVNRFLSHDLPLKIAIIDNASEAGHFAALKSGLPDTVELIRLEENRGWGGGLNVLLKRWLSGNPGEFCVVSAHDALPEGNCLRALLGCMQENAPVGIACPEYGKPEIPRYSPIRGARLILEQPRRAGVYERAEFPLGTLMVFRRACLQQIGLFDERYFAYGDETEIGLRARKYGWEVAIVWGAIVVNPGSWTPSPLLGYLWARSSLLMARVYGGWHAALFRACFILAHNVVLSLNRKNRNTISSPKARAWAVWDYYRGKFGSPRDRIPQLRPGGRINSLISLHG